MMAAPEPDGINWRTSSHSGNGGNCVEIAPAPGGVLIRDAKDSNSPVLAFPALVWRTFLTALAP